MSTAAPAPLVLMRFLRDETGASLMEYVLVIALIATVLTLMVLAMGQGA